MKKLMRIAGLSLTLCQPAFAFDNIEADAAYNGPIREQIEKEFKVGLQLLKAQAEGLKMQVREKDLSALAFHMYHKAVVMGGCLDEQITQRKLSAKGMSNSDVKGCIATRLKFFDWLENRKPDNSHFSRSFELCANMSELRPASKPEPPYEFLGIGALFRNDYASMKKCYDDNRIFIER